MMNTKSILHFDADAFFASVEQALNPKLKGKPVIVGGSDRGVVSAASYEARRFGVKSAMPIRTAKKLCRRGIFLNSNFAAYRTFSRQMFSIVRNYSPEVMETSVDEGYVNLTGTEKLYGKPILQIADDLLNSVRRKLGINISGGLAPTRVWSKMITQIAKPNGLMWLCPETGYQLIEKLPIGFLPGIGKKTENRLHELGIYTLGQVIQYPRKKLILKLGSCTDHFISNILGEDTWFFSLDAEGQKSYSKDRTLEEDIADHSKVHAIGRSLVDQLATKLRMDDKSAGSITIKIRFFDFEEVVRSLALPAPTNITPEFFVAYDRLFDKTINRSVPIRLIGVKFSAISFATTQSELFRDIEKTQKRDQTVDYIRLRMGKSAVRFAC